MNPLSEEVKVKLDRVVRSYDRGLISDPAMPMIDILFQENITNNIDEASKIVNEYLNQA